MSLHHLQNTAGHSRADSSSQRPGWVNSLTPLSFESLLYLSIFKSGTSVFESRISHAICEERKKSYDHPEVDKHLIWEDIERQNFLRIHSSFASPCGRHQLDSSCRSWEPQGVILGHVMFDTFVDVLDELTIHVA